MKPVKLYGKKCILVLFEDLLVSRAVHIAGNLCHDGIFPVFI